MDPSMAIHPDGISTLPPNRKCDCRTRAVWSNNRFDGLTTKDAASNDNASNMIAGTIILCIANLSAQMVDSLAANATQINALLHQLAAINNQLHLQHQGMMQ
jgi:hypothetical protein